MTVRRNGPQHPEDADVDHGQAATPPQPDPAPIGPTPVDTDLIERIFGPRSEAASNERDERDTGGLDDDWYRENRPPHHGD